MTFQIYNFPMTNRSSILYSVWEISDFTGFIYRDSEKGYWGSMDDLKEVTLESVYSVWMRTFWNKDQEDNILMIIEWLFMPGP